MHGAITHDAIDDGFNPVMMRLDVGLHRVDSEERPSRSGDGRKQRRHGLLIDQPANVGSVIADEQSFGDGVISVERKRAIFGVDNRKAPADEREFFTNRFGEPPCRHLCDRGTRDRGFQLGDAGALGADDRDHRNAEFLLQLFR